MEILTKWYFLCLDNTGTFTYHNETEVFQNHPKKDDSFDMLLQKVKEKLQETRK